MWLKFSKSAQNPLTGYSTNKVFHHLISETVSEFVKIAFSVGSNLKNEFPKECEDD